MTPKLRTLYTGLAAALALLTLACGTEPIPRVAVAGTTISIFVPDQFRPAFGRVLVGSGTPYLANGNFDAPYSQTSLREDEQRGELAFFLYPQSDPAAPPIHLPLRYITRVQPDEASPHVLSATAPPTPRGSVFPELSDAGQALAFIDVPVSVPAGAYWIRVQRYLRDPATGEFQPQPNLVPNPSNPSTKIDYRAWVGPSPQRGIPLRVVANNGLGAQFDPIQGWDLWAYNGELTANPSTGDLIAQLVPFPALEVRVADDTDPLTPAAPAAWSLEVEFPRRKVAIRGVSLERLHRSGALVQWTADPSLACADPGPDLGTIRIQMVDAKRSTGGVRIVFEPVNFLDACGGRVAPDDFAIVPSSIHLYDDDGEPLLSGAYSPEIGEIL